MTDTIAVAHPFDEPAMESLAKWHDAGAKKFRVNATLGDSHRAAAAVIRNSITENNTLHERCLAQDVEIHRLNYELGKFRTALQHARDTRPNANYLTVSLDVSEVDALLGGSKR